MDDTYFDGHDELYLRAKFGEDRTMRAGCRCENVVFVFFVFVTGKLPVLNLLTGQKSGFSPLRGDSLHRFTSNLAGLTATLVRLAVQNFVSIGADVWECGPQKYQKFPLFGKESPSRGDSLYRFPSVNRTTHAGCRCENVVFVFFFVFLPAGCREAANCRYCFYSQAKNQVFRPVYVVCAVYVAAF